MCVRFSVFCCVFFFFFFKFAPVFFFVCVSCRRFIHFKESDVNILWCHTWNCMLFCLVLLLSWFYEFLGFFRLFIRCVSTWMYECMCVCVLWHVCAYLCAPVSVYVCTNIVSMHKRKIYWIILRLYACVHTLRAVHEVNPL